MDSLYAVGLMYLLLPTFVSPLCFFWLLVDVWRVEAAAQLAFSPGWCVWVAGPDWGVYQGCALQHTVQNVVPVGPSCLLHVL
jgi:hypothetical protein